MEGHGAHDQAPKLGAESNPRLVIKALCQADLKSGRWKSKLHQPSSFQIITHCLVGSMVHFMVSVMIRIGQSKILSQPRAVTL